MNRTALTCPTCNTLFDKLRSARSDEDPPQLGDIILCADCGTVCEIDLIGKPIQLTKEKFDEFTPQEKSDYILAVRIIKTHCKNISLNKQTFLNN